MRGFKDLFFAICTETNNVETYDTPERMAEAMTADLSVSTADGSLYADDSLSESITEFVKATLKLGVKDLPPTVTAKVLGQTVDKIMSRRMGKEFLQEFTEGPAERHPSPKVNAIW